MARNIRDLQGATAYDNAGEKVGDVSQVYVDDHSGQPTFIEVNHGLFGMGSSLVPLRGHDFSGDKLQLAYSKELIKDAPDFDENQALTPADQERINRHYGLEGKESRTEYEDGHHGRTDRTGAAGAGVGAAGAGAGAAAGAHHGHDTEHHGNKAGTADDAELVRSEEQLNVTKERENSGEVRLRKYVVTDTETVEVPVTREEVHVERTPISAEEARHHTGTIKDGAEDEASVTLHSERVNVEKETVPVEKVSLNKETVHDTETHTEELRKEQIDSEGVDETTKKHRR